MTLLQKRRKNGDLFPSLTSDLLEHSFFPRLWDAENDFWNWNVAAKVPLANITETQNDYQVELCVPGLKREDFHVDLDEGMLTISCEKEEEKKEEKANYKRREFSYNSFSRSFRLPENIMEDGINAKYENGMLKVSIPKKSVSITKPKKAINVK